MPASWSKWRKVRDLFREPLHPYTQLLIASLPSLDGKERSAGDRRLAALAAQPAAGLPLPPALPVRHGPLQGRDAAAARDCSRATWLPAILYEDVSDSRAALLEARDVSKVFGAGLVHKTRNRRPEGFLVHDRAARHLGHRHRRRERQRQDDAGPPPPRVDRPDHRRGALPRQGSAASRRQERRSYLRRCAGDLSGPVRGLQPVLQGRSRAGITDPELRPRQVEAGAASADGRGAVGRRTAGRRRRWAAIRTS